MIARHQHEHEAINAREYPGTRQLCEICQEPTERCEDDSIYTEGETVYFEVKLQGNAVQVNLSRVWLQIHPHNTGHPPLPR